MAKATAKKTTKVARAKGGAAPEALVEAPPLAMIKPTIKLIVRGLMTSQGKTIPEGSVVLTGTPANGLDDADIDKAIARGGLHCRPL